MHPVVRQLPNTLTLLGLVCGCLSIVHAFNYNLLEEATGLKWPWAPLLIFFAAGFDVLDGAAARALRAQTAVGAQLDSLADLVNFGVAPAMLLMNMVLYSHAFAFENNLAQQAALAAPLLLPVFSAVRLARFNLGQAHSPAGFRGLPTPAAGMFIASIFLLLADSAWSPVFEPLVSARLLILLCVGISVLLLAPLPLLSLKPHGRGFGRAWPQWLLFLGSVAIVGGLDWAAGPFVLGWYLLVSGFVALQRS